MIISATEKLRAKSVKAISLELSLDTVEMTGSMPNILASSGYGVEIAQPFLLTLYACDSQDNKQPAGIVQAVHHKTIFGLALDAEYRTCRQIIFLDMLYVYPEYDGCGLATSVLEVLPELVGKELGGMVDAILLAPVPLYRNEEGQIAQRPMGIEFFVQYKRLLEFYKNRDFQFCQNGFVMGKRLNQ